MHDLTSHKNMFMSIKKKMFYSMKSQNPYEFIRLKTVITILASK